MGQRLPKTEIIPQESNHNSRIFFMKVISTLLSTARKHKKNLWAIVPESKKPE